MDLEGEMDKQAAEEMIAQRAVLRESSNCHLVLLHFASLIMVWSMGKGIERLEPLVLLAGRVRLFPQSAYLEGGVFS